MVLNPTTATRERLYRELENYVLNPLVPDTLYHRRVWALAHSEEKLTPNDFIHHINGNHFDNRLENLQKVTPSEHAKLHAILNKSL